MASPTASAIPGSRPIVRTPSVVTIERTTDARQAVVPTERSEVEEAQHSKHHDGCQRRLGQRTGGAVKNSSTAAITIAATMPVN